MIKVLIADDHVLIREGLKKILEDEIDISVMGEASNVAEALNFIKRNEIDVLVLDISLPDRSGLEAISDFLSIRPELKILILSIHPEDRFALRALKLGALSYLTKESAPEELVRAIQKIITGRQYINESLGEQLAYSFTKPSNRKPHESLSEREFQVLCLLGSGKSVSHVADEINLSISTVNTYRIRVLEKLEMKSNADIIRYCLEQKIVD